ncbi:MAG TPA: arsenite methyltransferase [Thermomicrobiales bacterium]
MTIQPASTPEAIRESVRSRYAEQARRAIVMTPSGGCCSSTSRSCHPISGNLYAPSEVAELPAAAVQASLGCGNPTALANLSPGEIVLDLGSGGGIDVLLSARRVGPTGFVYGLDMTDEMLELAEANRRQAGIENVRFLKGQIEAIPLPDNAVDVVISNCVINLSADKPKALREAYRVLKPGGRFAVSDVVVQGELPADLRSDMEAWVGCVAGALEEEQYRQYLGEAGFTDIEVEVTRVYDPRELAESGSEGQGCCGAAPAKWEESAYARFAASGGRIVSAFVRARKP